MFPKLIPFVITSSTSAATTAYVTLPVRCTLKTVQAAVNADPGDSDTITVNDGTNDIGVLAFGTGVAAGDTGTYTADATYGSTVFAAGDTLLLTVTATADNATLIHGYLEIDEYART